MDDLKKIQQAVNRYASNLLKFNNGHFPSCRCSWCNAIYRLMLSLDGLLKEETKKDILNHANNITKAYFESKISHIEDIVGQLTELKRLFWCAER